MSFYRSCEAGSLNASLAEGAIVLCFQSRTKSSAASTAGNVQDVGGVGIIFVQYPTKDVTLTFAIPCVQIDFTIGTSIVTYIESNRCKTTFFSPCFSLLSQKDLCIFFIVIRLWRLVAQEQLSENKHRRKLHSSQPEDQVHCPRQYSRYFCFRNFDLYLTFFNFGFWNVIMDLTARYSCSGG